MAPDSLGGAESSSCVIICLARREGGCRSGREEDMMLGSVGESVGASGCYGRKEGGCHFVEGLVGWVSVLEVQRSRKDGGLEYVY